jgi:2-haloacid dehalogenase
MAIREILEALMQNLPLLVFDVNETLLDLDIMSPTFERIFHEKVAMREWFANLILYSEALTLAQSYVPFTEIGAAAMEMLAATRGVQITEAEKRGLIDKFSTMPAHPEVPGALARLRQAGFRLFTLTDNLLEVQVRQLESAGIIRYFERCFSVDQEVRQHKPARQAYRYVERQVQASSSQLFLIAAHTWDTLGAVAAGWGAALIKRPGNEILGVGPQPTLVGSDLDDIADQLMARFVR